MSEVKIPDFLKYIPNKEPCKLHKLIKEYERRFGKSWSTEEFGDEIVKELENIFETCLKENRLFYDVVGMNPEYDEDEDY